MEFNFTMLSQIISFLFFFYVLKKILFEPLVKFLDERAAKIKNNIDNSEKKLSEAEALKAEYANKLKEFSNEMDKMRDNARQEMQQEKNQIIKEAKLQADKIIEDAKLSINEQVQKAKKELIKEIGEYSVLLSKQILEKEVKVSDNERIINQFLKTFGEN